MRGELRKICKRLMNRAVVLALESWREHTVEEMRKRLLMTRIVTRMSGNLVSRSFERWAQKVDELQREHAGEERKNDLMKRIVSRMLNQIMAGGFECWCENRKERASERKVMGRIMLRMKNQSLSAALERWVGNAIALTVKRAEEERKQLIMQRIIKRMLNVTISTALQLWHQNVVANKTMASKSLKSIARWANQCVASTLDVWHEYIVEEKRKRNLMTRIVQRLQRRGIVLAYDLWYSNVVLVVQERAEQDQHNHIMQKIVKRMLNRAIAGVFQEWHAKMVAKNGMVAKYNKVATRWKMQADTECIVAWYEYTTEEVRKRDLVTRIAMQMKNKASAMIIEMWQEAVAKVRAEHAEEQRLQTVKDKITWRILHRSVSLAFENWNSNVEDILQERMEEELRHAKMQTNVKRMQKGSISIFFSCWCENMNELKVEHNEEEKRRIIVQRIINKLNSQSLSSAYNMWKQKADDIISASHYSKSATARKIAAKKALHVISTFSISWLETIQKQALEMHESLEELEAAHVELNIQLRTSQQIHEASKTKTVTRILARIGNQTLAAALQGWRNKVQKLRTVSTKAIKVLIRWKHQSVLMCLNAWHGHTAEEVKQRALMKRILLRMTGHFMLESLEQWVDNVQALQSGRAEKEHKHDVVVRIMSRMMSQSMAQGFDCWRDHTVGEKQLKFKASKALQRLINGTLVLSLEHWRTYAADEKRSRTKMRKMVHKMLNRCILTALEKWREIVYESVWKKNLLRRIVVHMANNVISSAFTRWCKGVGELEAEQNKREKNKHVLQRIVLRLKSQCVSAAYARWCENVDDLKVEQAEEQRQTALMRRILARMTHRCMLMILVRWSENVDEVVAQRVAVDMDQSLTQQDALKHQYVAQKRLGQIVQRKMHVRLLQSFHRWRDYVGLLTKVDASIESSLRTSQKMRLKFSFRLWFVLIQSAQRSRISGVSVLSRVIAPSVQRYVDSWTHTTAQAKRALSIDAKLHQKTSRDLAITGLQLWKQYIYNEDFCRLRTKRTLARKHAHMCAVWFEHWRACILNRQRCRRCCLKIKVNLGNRLVSNYLERWSVLRSRACCVKHTLMRALQKTNWKMCYVSFDTWCQYVLGQHAATVSAANHTKLQAQEQQKRYEAVHALQAQHEAWQIRVMTSIHLRMTHRSTSLAFGKWVAHGEDLRVHLQGDKEREEAGKQAVEMAGKVSSAIALVAAADKEMHVSNDAHKRAEEQIIAASAEAQKRRKEAEYLVQERDAIKGKLLQADETMFAIEGQMGECEELWSAVQMQVEVVISGVNNYKIQMLQVDLHDDNETPCEEIIKVARPSAVRATRRAKPPPPLTTKLDEQHDSEQGLSGMGEESKSGTPVSTWINASSVAGSTHTLLPSTSNWLQLAPNSLDMGYVGLLITDTRPHKVTAVGDLVDQNHVKQGMPGYANEVVMPGDDLVEVDGRDCRLVSAQSFAVTHCTHYITLQHTL